MQLMFAFVVCLGLIGSSVLAAPPCDVNGCTYGTAEEGVLTIKFNSSGYFPACIRLTAGDFVTFTGSFATFPLSSGYLDDGNVEVAFASEITDVNNGTSSSFEMVTAGVVPFYSPTNAIDGLKGAIYVGTSCDSTPVAPTAAPTTPTAAPTTPTAAPTTPTAAPTTPTAAPTTPTAAPTTPTAEPVAEPQTDTPSSEPVAEPTAESPVASPTSSAPRPARTRVSSGVQTIASFAALAVVGVAML